MFIDSTESSGDKSEERYGSMGTGERFPIARNRSSGPPLQFLQKLSDSLVLCIAETKNADIIKAYPRGKQQNTKGKTMSKLYSITNRKLTKNDFKKALRESKTESLGVDSAMLTNEFPMYAEKIMQAVGEVMVERI